jgi:transcriptional regulator with XRE-family HTH domain
MAATWKSIRKLRDVAGISQGELARELRCSQAWLSGREQGAPLSRADAIRAVRAIANIRERRDERADRMVGQLNERLEEQGTPRGATECVGEGAV